MNSKATKQRENQVDINYFCKLEVDGNNCQFYDTQSVVCIVDSGQHKQFQGRV